MLTIPFSTSQAAAMLLGAFITKQWGPNPCDIDGNPRRLEDLGKGRAARQRIERDERQSREQELP
jgi:hypothetical protein